MPTDRFILVGAGGHARVVFDALRAAAADANVEIRDDVAADPAAAFGGRAVSAPALPPSPGGRAHVAIGNNEVRRRFSLALLGQGVILATVAHPHSTLSPTATLASGVFLAARCVIGPVAQVGAGVIVNHAAVIDHDCVIGEFTHIAPGAILGGGVQVGAGVLIGAGAVILPGMKVADGVTVGAGAVVTRDVAGGVVIGAPARLLAQRT